MLVLVMISCQVQAEGPLLPGGIQFAVSNELQPDDREKLWELRSKAHVYLADRGAKGQLSYLKYDRSGSLNVQVVPYQLPSYLDWPVLRSVASVWQQFAAVLRTIFGSTIQPAAVCLDEQGLPGRGGNFTGEGALVSPDVIAKQRVWEGEHLNVLYNYRPIKTESQVHFLLTVKPAEAARDFSEVTQAQYAEVLELAQRIDKKAREHWSTEAVETHVLDKVGRFAGQTESVYHAHVVVVLNKSDDFWGKLSLLWRMVWSPSPLPADELSRRVEAQREIFFAD